jgi:hypothetical protein
MLANDENDEKKEEIEVGMIAKVWGNESRILNLPSEITSKT